jgi:transposase-like protein
MVLLEVSAGVAQCSVPRAYPRPLLSCRTAPTTRFRREVTKLKAERDILKKAAAYFAKEST